MTGQTDDKIPEDASDPGRRAKLGRLLAQGDVATIQADRRVQEVYVGMSI